MIVPQNLIAAGTVTVCRHISVYVRVIYAWALTVYVHVVGSWPQTSTRPTHPPQQTWTSPLTGQDDVQRLSCFTRGRSLLRRVHHGRDLSPLYSLPIGLRLSPGRAQKQLIGTSH